MMASPSMYFAGIAGKLDYKRIAASTFRAPASLVPHDAESNWGAQTATASCCIPLVGFLAKDYIAHFPL
jgi:hypothetical protein